MQPPKAANNITCMGLCCHLAWPYSTHINVLCKPATHQLQWPCMQQRKESQRLSRSLSQCCKTWHLLFAKWGGDTIQFCTILPSEMAPPLLSTRDTCMCLCCHLAWPYSTHINVMCKPATHLLQWPCMQQRKESQIQCRTLPESVGSLRPRWRKS